MRVRRAGVLLPLSALPSPYGIGDLGPQAYHTVELLARSGYRVWQILPLNPTHPRYGNSPYLSSSVFAGNPLLISPEKLVAAGLLQPEELSPPDFPEGRVDYPAVMAWKRRILSRAAARFRPGPDFEAFRRREAFWLEDYALFAALSEALGPWPEWEPGLKFGEPAALKRAQEELAPEIHRVFCEQYFFFRQWKELKEFARAHGVFIFGDLPFYPGYESFEVWRFPEIFKLDEEKRPLRVAGVPPDYFSATGQLWGNPVYDWEALRREGFSWWLSRLEHNLRLFDLLRLDHFRGLCACWEIPYGATEATSGEWVPVPGEEFLRAVFRRFWAPALVAEDLGYITPEVHALRKRFGIPGMKVLLFAFFEDDSPYLPHRHEPESVVYTGTHDTNTARGWFERELSGKALKRLELYLGKVVGAEEIARALIRLAHTSPARLSIIPVQDLLGLGEEARINHPSRPEGNWEWRLRPEELERAFSPESLPLLRLTGRA